jgi:hypothetical protein
MEQVFKIKRLPNSSDGFLGYPLPLQAYVIYQGLKLAFGLFLFTDSVPLTREYPQIYYFTI